MASQGLDPSQNCIAERGETQKLHGRGLGTDNRRTRSRGTQGHKIGKEQVRQVNPNALLNVTCSAPMPYNYILETEASLVRTPWVDRWLILRCLNG